MQERLEAFVENEIGLEKSDRCLLAVSGGADSMVMLHLFKLMNQPFEVAHVNYGLRADESDGDEAFVREICKTMGVRLHVKRCEPNELMGKSGIQETARIIRYAWFEEILDEQKLDFIATAHNQTDQVETVLLHQLRGTGIKGYGGMLVKRDRIIRPMLAFTSEDIRSYALQSDIAYREDSSNQKDAYTRNRIRHDVLPVLKAIQPDLEDRFMENSWFAKQWWDTAQHAIQQMVKEEEKGHWTIPISALKGFPHPHVALYSILNSCGFSADQCLEIMRHPSTGNQFESASHVVEVRNDNLTVFPHAIEPVNPVSIHSAGTWTVGRWAFNVEESDVVAEVETPDKWVVAFDGDEVTFPLLIRVWHEGDRIKPFGMNGSKLVSDVYNEHSVLIRDRQLRPMVLQGDTIIWLPGLRRSIHAPVRSTTQKIIQITCTTDE